MNRAPVTTDYHRPVDGMLARIGAVAAGGAFGATGRVFVTIGLLGAFTTFSTFSYETLEALRLRHWGIGLGNVAASLVLGLVAFWVGLVVGHRL